MHDLDKYLKRIRILAYAAAPKEGVVDSVGFDRSDYVSELLTTAWGAQRACIERYGPAMPFERCYVEQACRNRLCDLMRKRKRRGDLVYANSVLVDGVLSDENFEAGIEARESLERLQEGLEDWRWDLMATVGVWGPKMGKAAAASLGRSRDDVRHTRRFAAELLG